MKSSVTATVAQLSEFTEIIDARTPAEFAEDHIPGAINLPVLNDEERIKVGTLYKQVSPLEAKKVGAAMVSRHLAEHLEQFFHAKPTDYRPLVYCWRGGKRSGSMAHLLQQVGYQASQLEGGYKAYRRTVTAELETLPGQLKFRVVCGPTGCGKSRLLHALQTKGAQVLDLEYLACHRGSLLGGLPGTPQPSQKAFESLIWSQLRQFDATKPVFVESESKKIGGLRVPDALLSAMRQGHGVWLEAAIEQRVLLLLEEYGHFLQEPEMLLKQIEHLVPLRGHAMVDHWKTLIQSKLWDDFVRDMLQNHYDPAYQKSLDRNYGASAAVRTWPLTGINNGDFNLLAEDMLSSGTLAKESQTASLKSGG